MIAAVAAGRSQRVARRYNEPSGYTPIVVRPFDTKASNDSDRGTGSFPSKLGGSEGWDGSEWDDTNLSIVNGAMRVTYPVGLAAGNGPGTFQTQSLGSYPNLYTRTIITLGSTYHVGGVQNKLWFHRTADPHHGEPFLSLLSNGDGTFKMHVNFQGTPDAADGFTAATDIGAALAKQTRYTIETLLLMSSGSGQADGVFRAWVNRRQVLNVTDVTYYDGSSGNTTWAAFHVAPTYGGGDPEGSTNETEFYWDMHDSYISGKA